MKYFSYGSNMSFKRMAARVPSAAVDTAATLKGHVLKFRKRSNMDGSAKCDVVETSSEADVVWGVVYDIDAVEKIYLDIAEGLGNGYEQKEIELTGPNGNTFRAFTYYATHIDDSLKPYTWYTEHVLRGARENGLPPEYTALIEKIESIRDPDQGRHDRELSIYRWQGAAAGQPGRYASVRQLRTRAIRHSQEERYELELTESDTILFATANGALNATTDMDIDEALRRECEDREKDLLLIDIRSMSTRPSVIDNHIAATAFRSRMGNYVRAIAIVGTENFSRNSEMFEMTAVNRGARVRFFTEYENAKNWLAGFAN